MIVFSATCMHESLFNTCVYSCTVETGAAHRQATAGSGSAGRTTTHPQHSCAFPIFYVPEPCSAAVCACQRAPFVLCTLHEGNGVAVRQHNHSTPCCRIPHSSCVVFASGDEHAAILRQPPTPHRVAVPAAYVGSLPENHVPYTGGAVLGDRHQRVPLLQHNAQPSCIPARAPDDHVCFANIPSTTKHWRLLGSQANEQIMLMADEACHSQMDRPAFVRYF